MNLTPYDLPTPSLILDRKRLDRNINRLAARLPAAGVRLRPHLKTAKSVDLARIVLAGHEPAITVSTLKEAEIFLQAGVRDILYAVQIAPAKLGAVTSLRRAGARLMIVTDNEAAARAVSQHSIASQDPIDCLIEIDIDGHRGGIAASDTKTLLAIARTLGQGARLAGVMTHAGESYNLSDPGDLMTAAEAERRGACLAADTLRRAGFACPVVSIGSSPTAHALSCHEGITEIRAGVYMFGDLVQTQTGVCEPDDIALSVLASVIGHQPAKGWILTDCGWSALSCDPGHPGKGPTYGFGQVCDILGNVLDDLIVLNLNQEHGIIGVRPGSARPFPDLPVGTRLRILPNHACAAAEMHDRYHVLEDGIITAQWPRFRGWSLSRPEPSPQTRRIAIVDADSVRHSSSRQRALEAVKTAFCNLTSNAAEVFPVVNALVRPPDTAFSIKAGVDHEYRLAGLKVGSFWPSNKARPGLESHNSTTLLLDYETGAPRALINAAALNGLRTAAANAAATDRLAREDAATLLLVGAGHQAGFEARAISDVRCLRRLLIWARDPSRAEALAAELAGLAREIVIASDIESAASEADMITTVTNARAPILPASAIRLGTHISAMGADMAGKQEIDPEILRTATLFADLPSQSARIGEFQHICALGIRRQEEIRPIGGVLSGLVAGRTSQEEITVFDSSGLAVQDLHVAAAILERVLAVGNGLEISF